MLKDGGSIFFSTINKTIKSYFCGILAAKKEERFEIVYAEKATES